jgi:transcriptional regulator with XRE-family HTH domain
MEPVDDARAFGAAVRALRTDAGLSLNELARRAGVDVAYVHRIEPRSGPSRRAPLPRRPIVLALAAALGCDARQTDRLLALAGHVPGALVELGGWDATLASVADVLSDPHLSRAAKDEFREVLRLLAVRWGRPETKNPSAQNAADAQS